MVNNPRPGVALCERIGSPASGGPADTYHMNIEGRPLGPLSPTGPWIRHVQRSDSNRLEPGPPSGLDRAAGRHLVDRLRDELAYECRLSGAGGRRTAGVGAADASGGLVVNHRVVADRRRCRPAAPGRGARADRQLARPLDRPLPQPYPHQWIWTGLHRARPAHWGRGGRRPSCSACSGAVVGRPDPAHRLQPGGRPTPYFPGPTFCGRRT